MGEQSQEGYLRKSFLDTGRRRHKDTEASVFCMLESQQGLLWLEWKERQRALSADSTAAMFAKVCILFGAWVKQHNFKKEVLISILPSGRTQLTATQNPSLGFPCD